MKTWMTGIVMFNAALLACFSLLAGIGVWHTTHVSRATAAEIHGVARAPERPDIGRISAAVRSLPLYFVKNAGQHDARVAFAVRGHDTAVYFAGDGVTFALTKREGEAPESSRAVVRRVSLGAEPAPKQRWAVKLDFVGANRVSPVGQELTPATVSYFRGRDGGWSGSAETYHELVYPELWPGIDLVYTGAGGQLKSTFIVKPGADPRLIRLAYRGASDVRVTDEGRLEVSTPAGSFADDRPFAYQEDNGVRTAVPVAFAPAPVSSDAQGYGFTVGRYDRSKTLVLDPTLLVYSGFIGGAGIDEANGIAVDKAGNAYVVGTVSDGTAFPVKVGPDLTHDWGEDVFVAKIKADGSGLVYAGFIGGTANDRGEAIAVDAYGNAYVTGSTTSTDTSFPKKIGPKLTRSAVYDGFVAKINAAGTALVYCGYIGGGNDDSGTAIDVDAAGNAYVGGWTGATAFTFPVHVGPGLQTGGGVDGFVAKVKADGTGFVYAGFLGGGGDDVVNGITVDAAGRAYVTGTTTSDQTTFPVKLGPDLTFNGGAHDAFVAAVEADGSGLVWAGYVGGAGDDGGNAIAIDAIGHLYITGATTSDEASFPVKGGPGLFHGGNVDAFVTKIAAGGGSLVYSGYIGGTGEDRGFGIAVDADGNAYVAGSTSSDETSFPVKAGPSVVHGGSDDAFVAKVDASGTALLWAGYIGGTGKDEAHAIALDSARNVYVAGATATSDGSFPVAGGLDQVYNGGASDAFVTKVSGRPDLRPSFIGVSATAVKPGGTFTVGDLTGNVGLGTSPSAGVRYYFSANGVKDAGDILLTGTRSTPILLPGATSFGNVPVKVPLNVALGGYRVIACVDETKSIAEVDDTNNCVSTVSLVQVTLPDLVTMTVSASLGTVQRGHTMWITDEVKNIGGVDAGATTSRYWLSKDLVKGTDTLLTGVSAVPALAPNALSIGTTSVKIPATMTPGVYFLFACADDLKKVPETSELNNCKIGTSTVTVTQ